MLFDDNIGFITYDLFKNDNLKSLNTYDILSPWEGFLRGNIYKDEYLPYKNYKYFDLNPKNKREQLLYEIMALDFAIVDLSLSLDLDPDNKELSNRFKKAVNDVCQKEIEYVNIYGPLTIDEADDKNYNWLNGPWPWENEGGSKYV